MVDYAVLLCAISQKLRMPEVEPCRASALWSEDDAHIFIIGISQ